MNADPKPSCISTNEAEPTAVLTPMPVWLVAVMLALLFLSAWYFDVSGGWFEPKVYAPYHSLADLQRYQPNSDPDASYLAQGRKLFAENCAVCHMETGIGNPANGCPPLVGSEWVKHPTPDRVIMIVSKGLAGPITVNGKVYNTGVMLAVGDSLPGDEKEKSFKIGAIISYVRKQFGDVSVVVKPEHVEGVRANIKNHTGNYTPEDLLKVP